jgi:hypothetical protein
MGQPIGKMWGGTNGFPQMGGAAGRAMACIQGIFLPEQWLTPPFRLGSRRISQKGVNR